MDNIPDQRIRRKVFWIVFVIAIGIISSGFFIEKIISYSLLEYPGFIKFGYTGFHLAKIPTKEEVGDKRRIIMLGNSVYQFNKIPRYMQAIADQEKSRLVFLNMAQTSSTIYDYLVQTAKIVDAHPDLVVYCMNEGTFSLNPKFKTDSDQFVFDEDVLKVMPVTFYYRYFTYKTAIDSLLSSLIPLKRIDPIMRWKFRLRSWLPEWFFNSVSYPYLIFPMGGDVKTIQMTELARSSGDEKFIVLREVLNILQEHRIPALFIWQETKYVQSASEYEKTRRILEYEMIRKYIKSRDNTFFIDLSSFWDPVTFADTIHPKQLYVTAYARRHYNAVVKALAFFEDKQQRKQDQ